METVAWIFRRIKSFIVCSFFAVFTIQLNALQIVDPLLEFEVSSKPELLKIKGKGTALSYSSVLSEANLWTETFVFDLNSLSTGLDLKDKLIKKKCLEVEKYPQASLVVKNSKNSVLAIQKPTRIKAALTLKGVTRDIWINANKEGDLLKAKFEVSPSRFSIEAPSWNGLKLADKVTISTLFKIQDEPAAPVLAR